MDTVDFITDSLGHHFTYDYANTVKTAGLSLLQECHQDFPQPENVPVGMTYIPADILTGQFHLSYYTAEEKSREDIARIARAARREQIADRAPVLI